MIDRPPGGSKPYTAYRGLHQVSLAEFRSDYPQTHGEATYVEATRGDRGPAWSPTFVTSTPGVVPPGPEQLHRGLLLRMSVPEDAFTWRPNPVDNGQSLFVNTLDAQKVPDLKPLISDIGFAGQDGKFTFYPYKDLYTAEGKLTPLAEAIDAKMVDGKTPAT